MNTIAADITEYLANGGLCNPELVDHDTVCDLLIAARAEIARLQPTAAERHEIALAAAEIEGWGGYVTAEMLHAFLERTR